MKTNSLKDNQTAIIGPVPVLNFEINYVCLKFNHPWQSSKLSLYLDLFIKNNINIVNFWKLGPGAIISKELADDYSVSFLSYSNR